MDILMRRARHASVPPQDGWSHRRERAELCVLILQMSYLSLQVDQTLELPVVLVAATLAVLLQALQTERRISFPLFRSRERTTHLLDVRHVHVLGCC